MRRICALGLALALIAAVAAPAAAQKYPARTVSVIVPYPAGGSVDGVARILVQKLNETVGQHFIVENRAGGASGTVGANAVARAAPDGYTLLVSASVHVINPFLYKNLPYDVVKDFTPVTLLADGPLIVSTTPSVKANNLKDFFEQVRKAPTKFTFGTTSLGSASHLAIELLKRDAGLDTLVIPYKGTAPALTDLVSGQIQLLADPMLSSLPLARAGKIKALGLTSLKRAAAAPEIPTVEESGMKGFEFVSWYGLWGPRNLPPDVNAYLQAAVAKVLALPEVKKRLDRARLRSDRLDVGALRQVHRRRDGEIRRHHPRRQDRRAAAIVLGCRPAPAARRGSPCRNASAAGSRRSAPRAASCSSQDARGSAPPVRARSRDMPGLSTTKAVTASPHSVSGSPSTATSPTAGMRRDHVLDLLRHDARRCRSG